MDGHLLKSRAKARHFVLMATALASLASLLLGYDIVIDIHLLSRMMYSLD
jgi:hypothetical protein